MSTRIAHRVGLSVAFVLIAAGVAVVLFFALPKSDTAPVSAAPVAGSDQYPNQPAVAEVPLVQLDGKWTYKQGETAFVAEVKNGGIHIDLVSADGTSMTYWVGTFKSEAKSGVRLNSVVDTNEIILSQDPNKTFTIGDNTISFPFQAMGMKKTVVLSR